MDQVDHARRDGVGIDTHFRCRRRCVSIFPRLPLQYPPIPLRLSAQLLQTTSSMFGLSLLITLLLSIPALAQVTNSALLPGTWSTGSGAVLTGPVRFFANLLSNLTEEMDVFVGFLHP